MKKETKIMCHEGSSEITLAWYLHSETATAQFTVFLFSPTRNSFMEYSMKTLAADLGYHSDKPKYGGQGSMPCSLRSSGSCFYDGTSLGAQDVWNEFLAAKDEEVIWKALTKVIANLSNI